MTKKSDNNNFKSLPGNIETSAIGSHYGKIKITDDFEEHFENFKNCVKVAKILGTKVKVCS